MSTLDFRTKDIFKAWCIDTGENGLIGRYWWTTWRTGDNPVHLNGCQCSMFETRALARAELPNVKQAFHKAHVIHVKVTVEEI